MQNQSALRSFSRRIGKSLSNLQKDLLENKLPHHKIDENNPNNFDNYNKVNIEIGIGMAEHFMHNAKQSAEELFLGFEPYLNGIANALKIADKEDITNFKLWNDDADFILPKLNDESIDNIYILFPDPWPKSRQNKRRFLNKNRLNILQRILKKNGKIHFASDIKDYFDDVYNLMKDSNLKDISNPKFTPHESYTITKYHQKAVTEHRHPEFMIFTKKN